MHLSLVMAVLFSSPMMVTAVQFDRTDARLGERFVACFIGDFPEGTWFDVKYTWPGPYNFLDPATVLRWQTKACDTQLVDKNKHYAGPWTITAARPHHGAETGEWFPVHATMMVERRSWYVIWVIGYGIVPLIAILGAIFLVQFLYSEAKKKLATLDRYWKQK